MGRINSSIGTLAQNSNSANTMKKFTVDDPTLQQEDVPQQAPIFDRRRAQQFQATEEVPHAHERIDVADGEDVFEKVEEVRRTRAALEPDKKNKIELLLGLKRKYANVTIDGHEITLRNLTAKESKMLVKTAFTMQEENRQVDQLYDIRNYTIAFAIYAIDDVKISDILGENDNMDMRVSLIEEMPESAVSELHASYEEFIAIKAPKTEAEVKEVIEDIKK